MIFFTGPGEMKWSEKLSWLVTVSIFAASVSTNHEMMKTVQLVFHTVMIKTCFGNVHTFYCTALLNIYMDVFSFQHQLLLLKTFFLQIMKIIVWIVAFVLINIIIQLAELPCHGLSLKNVWITFWFLQNQLFWGLRTCWQSLLWLYRILWLWEWRICSFSLKSSRRGQILIY